MCVTNITVLRLFFSFLQTLLSVSLFGLVGRGGLMLAERGGGGGLMRGLSFSFRPSRWQRALWRAGLGEVNSYYG